MQVHRSHRMERLIDVLADVLCTPAGSALEPETLLVQSQGMERWLAQQLSLRLGVFANARFPFPRAFIEQVFDAVVPGDGPVSSYQREVLAFAILALLDELLPDAAFTPLRAYLEDDPLGIKRFQLAERVANAFDQYLVYRPRMILEWERGAGSEWQPRLWRALRQRLPGEHFAHRALGFFKEWSPLLLPAGALPRRISVVGVSSLPPIYLQVLSKLSERCDVQLFLLSPSREYFAQLRSLRQVLKTREHPELDLDDGQLEAVQGNPLVASLGGTGGQFQLILERDTEYREDDNDLFRLEPGSSLLEKLQRDLVLLRDATLQSEKHEVAPGDASVRVISCHSPFREIEVLRDQLLGLLQDDPSLGPEDILVMSPNLDVYAPLIDAVFGVDTDDPQYLAYRIADRSAQSTNLCARALLQLLEVIQGRMNASEVLDLLQLDPIRARFGIAASDLNLLQNLVHEAGIRWGIDAEHRASFQQPSEAKNTWRFGLERLLLGVALPGSDSELFAGVAAADEVEGESALLVGHLAEFAETLVWACREVRRTRSVTEWVQFLKQLVDRTLVTEDARAWQRRALFEALGKLTSHAELGGFQAPLALGCLVERLLSHFDSERTSHQFLAGGVTFCAMLPMRSIPFRVLVLLGMSDGEFPRLQKAASFDLLLESPQPGDRSLKDEDRYLFLEALLSARQHLLISYVGRSVQDNIALPPSPVVSELIEYIAGAFRCEGQPMRVLIEHPLQPFSPRYFQSPNRPGLFSFASAEARGADALCRQRSQPQPFLAAPLPAAEPTAQLTLDELIRFFQNPARAFLQQRLGVFLERDPRLVEDREPIQLDPLERYQLGSDLLEHALGQRTGSQIEPVTAARGCLPHGTPGALAYQDVWQEASEIAARAAPFLEQPRLEPLSFSMTLAGTAVKSQLRQLFPRAQLYWQYARVKPKNQLALWIRHLALNTRAVHGLPRRSVLFGRRLDEAQPETATCAFEPLDPDHAEQLLTQLVQLYQRGQNQPLPLFPAASRCFAWHLLNARGRDPEAFAFAKAQEEFAPTYVNVPSERDDAYVARAFFASDPLAPPPSDPELDFRALSKTVFMPLLRSLRSEART